MRADTITAFAAVAALAISILFSAIGAFSAYMLMQMKVQLVTLELSIAKGRISDAKEMREYLNGSFLRAKEAVLRIEAVEDRLDLIEERPSKH